MLNSSKQLPNCVARAEINIVPIVFDDVLYEIRAYTIIVSYMNQIPEVAFNNISAILWRSVLLVEQIDVTRENHRPVVSH
jgi:hypothetical protein